MKKGENLTKQTSSKDSMNLEKFDASFTESDLDKFILVFLLEDAIDELYFSLVLCSNTQHGVQLVLIMYKGETHFALVLRGIHD